MLMIEFVSASFIAAFVSKIANLSRAERSPNRDKHFREEKPLLMGPIQSSELALYQPLERSSIAYPPDTEQTSTATEEGGIRAVGKYMGVFAKRFLAMSLTRHGLIRLARYVPAARGLFEYTNFNGADDLLHFILMNQEQEALEILELIPQAALNRMLYKHDIGNNTILYHAADLNIRVYEKILQKLSPEQRFVHLSAVVGIGLLERPVMSHILSCLWESVGIDRLKITLNHLPTLLQAKLMASPDQKGDSIFLFHIRRNRKNQTQQLLGEFSSEQKKALFKTTCPHGITPVMELIDRCNLSDVKFIFDMLSHADWQEVFAFKPTGWSMTHGEKLMIVAYACEQSGSLAKGRKHEYIPYLSEGYGLSLPEGFPSLTQEQEEQELNNLRGFNMEAGCDEKYNFKKEHGKIPEAIFGLESWLPLRRYKLAYRQQQRLYHPDRNKSESARKKAIQLNAAHAFMENPNERKKYRSPLV